MYMFNIQCLSIYILYCYLEFVLEKIMPSWLKMQKQRYHIYFLVITTHFTKRLCTWIQCIISMPEEVNTLKKQFTSGSLTWNIGKSHRRDALMEEANKDSKCMSPVSTLSFVTLNPRHFLLPI